MFFLNYFVFFINFVKLVTEFTRLVAAFRLFWFPFTTPDISEAMADTSFTTFFALSAPSAAVADGTKVEAPMPGTILSVNVANGAAVKKGDVLLVLEAMKMENEIMAPKDGKITSVNVAKGATVNSGDLLFTIE